MYLQGLLSDTIRKKYKRYGKSLTYKYIPLKPYTYHYILYYTNICMYTYSYLISSLLINQYYIILNILYNIGFIHNIDSLVLQCYFYNYCIKNINIY